MNSALILLAAGSSSRLGQSKQLLKIGDQTLLERSIKTALQSNVSKVIVVLGAHAAEHKKIAVQFSVDIIENDKWENGIGSSVKAGVRYAINTLEIFDSVMIMVCDQPYVTKENINGLLSAFQKERCLVVASAYKNTVGVPALFDKTLFNELLSLDDQLGAKKIIQKYSAQLKQVDCPEGGVDIDTPEDFQALMKQQKQK